MLRTRILVRTFASKAATKPAMKSSKDLPQLPIEDVSPADRIARSKFLQSTFPSMESVKAEQLRQPESNSWYFIKRSRAGALPIYTEYKNDGSVKTVIRKIEGNVSQLRNDLLQELGLSRKQIFIKDTSKQVVVKGNQASVLRKLLGSYF